MTAPDPRQVAVVTEGAHGLGEIIVRRLHADGFRVAIADADGAAATALAKELDTTRISARGFAVDATVPAALQGLLANTFTYFGDPHVLVSSAACVQTGTASERDPEELEAVMAADFTTTFAACQIFGAVFADRGYGRIINVASSARQGTGTATGGRSASSKGAVLAATKVFARQFASHGVTVNAVSPGPLDNSTVRSIVGDDNLDAFMTTIPADQVGAPAFTSRMVSLLASPDAASVTGACWDLNGGFYLR